MHTTKKFRHRRPSPAPSPIPPGDTRSPNDAGTPHPLGEGKPRLAEAGERPTGPRTPEGKAVSARNATTHGLFSRQTVLPHLGEDADAYKKVLDALTEQFDPRTLMERQYLELWAEASWKLRRLSRWEAQLWEQSGLDEDARLGKLERVLRLQATLRRQLDKAVRMLSQDVPDVQKHYARRAVLASRSLTETDCRENPRIAYDVEAAAQDEILRAPGLLNFDRSHLDTPVMPQAHASDAPPAAPPAVLPTDAAPGLFVCDCTDEPAAWQDNEICQNEPLPPVATTAAAPATPPNPPIMAEASMPNGITAYRLAERGPQRSGEVGSGEVGSGEAPTAPCHQPLSLSEGGGVPDEGGVGAS